MTAAKEKIARICERCATDFLVFPYRKSARWCSKACWNDRTPWLQCPVCESQFKSNANRRVYCSRPCQARGMVGAASGHWKGGKSLDNERARRSIDLKHWRESVFARDGWACRHCGATGTIHAHHVEHWAKNEARRFDVANGLTLCIDCHGKVHGRDFSSRRIKICPYCERPTKGKGAESACRSCAIRLWHVQRRQTSLQLILELPFAP